MGWFDEQIKQRREADNAVFEDSFLNMAGAVMGRRMSEALNDDRQKAADAIGEILKYYHVKPQEVPETVTDMNEVLEYLLRPSGIMRRNVNLDKGWYHDAVGAMRGLAQLPLRRVTKQVEQLRRRGGSAAGDQPVGEG